jgi:hypothetical protein
MSLENWAINRWLEKLESDREEIERLLANADGHLGDYQKAVASEMSTDAQLSLAYDAIRASATAALRATGYLLWHRTPFGASLGSFAQYDTIYAQLKAESRNIICAQWGSRSFPARPSQVLMCPVMSFSAAGRNEHDPAQPAIEHRPIRLLQCLADDTQHRVDSQAQVRQRLRWCIAAVNHLSFLSVRDTNRRCFTVCC